MHTPSPQITSRETVYENPYQRILRVVADFRGFSKEYYVTDTGVRAGIVVARDNRVLLVRQYRLLIDTLSWEIPGGKVDENETPEAAAVRECLEETGIRCVAPRPLISYEAGLDVSQNPTHLFYCDKVDGQIDAESVHQREVAGSEWVPFSHCMDMVGDGRIRDSFSIIALLATHAGFYEPGDPSPVSESESI